MPSTLETLEAFTVDLARAAAAVTLPLFRGEMGHENKAGEGVFDPVTEADRGAEAAIRRLIGERFPNHGVIGEEYGEDRPDAEFVWILDPIDGTRAFISGLPLWTTLIALRHQGRPVIGAISQPYIGELFLGGPSGAVLMSRGETRPIRTRACARLADATISTTDPAIFCEGDRARWDRLRAGSRLARLGCDAYAYAMIAAGGIDLVAETELKVWDWSALIPVIEAAGGAVCDWSGGPAGTGGRMLAMGDAQLRHEALVALV